MSWEESFAGHPVKIQKDSEEQHLLVAVIEQNGGNIDTAMQIKRATDGQASEQIFNSGKSLKCLI